MVILADFSDTQLQVTCKRCEQTLQEGDRFCRYCGQDQLEGDPSAVIDITQAASNGEGEAFEPMSTQHAARRNAWREPVLLQEAAGRADTTDSRPGGAVAPSRWSMGLAAAVLLALAAVLSYDLYLGSKEEPARQVAQPLDAARDQAAAEAETQPPVPAVTTSPLAIAPKTQTEPAAAIADRKPADVSPPDAPAAAATVPPPPSAPIAKVIPDPPAPATSSSAPAEEAKGQGACPPAMAAMALCPNR